MKLGGEHVENPFILVGQISTAFYFAYFLIIVPAIGVIENTMMDLATQSETELADNASPAYALSH
jgi:ubiquinol-cytochrome c reductase cytochrome b subunit